MTTRASKKMNNVTNAGGKLPSALGAQRARHERARTSSPAAPSSPRHDQARSPNTALAAVTARTSGGDVGGEVGSCSNNNDDGADDDHDNDADGGHAAAADDENDDDDAGAGGELAALTNKSPKRRRRVVTVDSSKAKTSLEALKVSMGQLKWKEYPFGRRQPCDIYWHGTSFHDSENVCSGIVNKFPGMPELVRKVNLSRALRTMQQLFPDEYGFYPGSWILPDEFALFEADVLKLREKDPSRKLTFIVKPDGGSQGDGIFLISNPQDLQAAGCLRGRPTIVQEYVQRPLLLEKLKFDIRLYVLLASLDPLEVYVSREGLCRFCTEIYQEPNPKNLHRLYMHLTNYSLNVRSGRFVHSESGATGSKRTLRSVLGRLAARGLDARRLWCDLAALVLKTVLALAPGLRVSHHAEARARPGRDGPACFQILGFDILLLRNLKPVLLEVNANPSMKIDHDLEISPGVFDSVSSPVDEEVKVAVIRDALRVVATRIRKSANTASPRRLSVENLDGRVRATDNGNEASGRDPKLASFSDDYDAGDDDDDDDDYDSSEELGAGGLPPPCLKQVYPRFSKQFSHLRIVERVARLFLRFLGLRGDASLRMGPTGFRTFSRNCKLCTSSISMAYIDILYIDVTRRWNCPALQETGMSFQAFVEAFCQIAERRFAAAARLGVQVEALVELCEARLEGDTRRRPAAAHLRPPHPAHRHHAHHNHHLPQQQSPHQHAAAAYRRHRSPSRRGGFARSPARKAVTAQSAAALVGREGGCGDVTRAGATHKGPAATTDDGSTTSVASHSRGGVCGSLTGAASCKGPTATTNQSSPTTTTYSPTTTTYSPSTTTTYSPITTTTYSPITTTTSYSPTVTYSSSTSDRNQK